MRRARLDRFDRAMLLALVALAFLALGALVLRTVLQGGTVTGGDGYLVADPMQYLNWLRQAGESVGIANLYDLDDGPRPFVHPGLLLSGLLHQLGAGLIVAYSVWKPIAALVLFTGMRAISLRFLPRRDDRRLALVLGLFCASPIAALIGWSAIGGPAFSLSVDFITGELWAGTWLWGYQFTALAVGLMPLAILAYERGREGGARRLLAAAGALGLLCAWLQPWQGVTVACVLVAAELWAVYRTPRRLVAAAAEAAGPLLAIGAPLLYYLLLSRYDPSWELAGQVNELPRWDLHVIVLGLLPLGLPALLAVRLPAPAFGDVALRAWVPAALLVYLLPFGTFPFHAFQGLGLPLAVLAVAGVRARLGDRALWSPAVRGWVVAAVVLLVVPGTIYRVTELRDAINRGYQPFFLEDGERDALRFLDDDPEPGGVITGVYLGPVVPAYTGRETYTGAGSWTPEYERRRRATQVLFSGRVSPAGAERIVRASGARFIFVDCQDRPDISEAVRGFTDPPQRFGCATVYRVRD
ncbi:MAG: hypothetical protein ACSLFR_17345 [Solirubrobacteraceae bacterium]